MEKQPPQESGFTLKGIWSHLIAHKILYGLTAVGIAVYGNMLGNGFVYDDIKYIQNNPDIHAFNLKTIVGTSLFNGTGQYRPVPALLYTLLYSLFSGHALFYHAVQLVIQLVNTLLVFTLFRKFLPRAVSFVLALVFIVHPIQIESVSYISSMGNQLFFLFGIGALLISFKKPITPGRAAAICCLLLLSGLTKETGFLFVAVLAVLGFLFRRNQLKLLMSLGVVSALAYFYIRFFIAGVYFGTFQTIPIHRLPLLQRLLNVPAVIFYYLTTLVYPARLAILQNWVITSADWNGFFLPLLADIAAFGSMAAAGAYIKRHARDHFPAYLFFAAWFGMGVLFHSQVLPLDMTVADRWFYFPMAGLLGMAGVSLTAAEPLLANTIGKKRIRFALLAIAVLIISGLSVRTIVRNTNWSDERTLLLHDIAVSDDFSKENMLATDYLAEKKYELAAIHMEKSVALNGVAININNLGLTYYLMGDYKRAEMMFLRSIATGDTTNLIFANINLATIYTYHGDPRKAIPLLRDTLLPVYPDDASLWYMLAVAEYKAQNKEEAIAAALRAYAIVPDRNIAALYDLIMQDKPAADIKLGSPSFSTLP